MKTYLLILFALIVLSTAACDNMGNDCVDGLYESQPYSFCRNSDASHGSDENPPNDENENETGKLMGDWCYRYSKGSENEKPDYMTLSLDTDNNQVTLMERAHNLDAILNEDYSNITFTTNSLNENSETQTFNSSEYGSFILKLIGNDVLQMTKTGSAHHQIYIRDTFDNCILQGPAILGWDLVQ
ncbi:hypothetical protein K1X76_09040 [bacterium]|nr:hypothetical protein [bacterium]